MFLGEVPNPHSLEIKRELLRMEKLLQRSLINTSLAKGWKTSIWAVEIILLLAYYRIFECLNDSLHLLFSFSVI